jgi:hypothetical protein
MTEIKFKDGTILEVEHNGDSFITDDKPVFPSDLRDIEVEDGDVYYTISNGKIIECASIDERYWFAIIEKTEMEILKEQLSEQEDVLNFILMGGE